MATLSLQRLVCQEVQDLSGIDEAFLAIFVDGQYAGSVYRQLQEGQALQFAAQLEFTDRVSMQLWEVDNPAAGNPHDFLGQVEVTPATTETSGAFDGGGGRYRVEFAVSAGTLEAPATLTVRRNQATMTATDRQRFLGALNALIETGTFGRFVQDHTGPSGSFEFRNHGFATPGSDMGRMRFLPWHRAYLRNLERELQKVEPAAFIPYWRWTVDREIPSWLAGFTPDVPMPDGSTIQVTRNPGAMAPSLPSPSMVAGELANTSYATFSPAIEGGSHGRVHMWTGGTMSDAVVASADVLFWLHHCEVDRLWALWQQDHTGGPSLPVSERIMDPYAETVDQLDQTETVGYVYG